MECLKDALYRKEDALPKPAAAIAENADTLMEPYLPEQSCSGDFRYMEPAEQMIRQTLVPVAEKYRTEPEFCRYYDGYSALLGPVATLRENGVITAFQNLLSDLYDRLISEPDTRLLQISGPGGGEGNVLSQLLYLRMAVDVKAGAVSSLAPFYINLNHYRGTCETRDAAIAAMERDLGLFWRYTAGHPARTPVVFIDGIRNYAIDDFSLDYHLADCMREHIPEAKLVIAAERANIMNQSRQHILPDFADGQFRYEVSVESVNLLNREQSEAYFKAFEKLYGVESGPVCRKLRSLGLAAVDPCQLRLLLPELANAENISGLYESVSKTFLGGDSRDELEEITSWIYQFVCTAGELEPVSGRLKQLITSHESFRDFFLARWYVSRLRAGTVQEKLRDLDMLLPGAVTAFVLPMLSGDTCLESQLLRFMEQNYARMSLQAKSQMNYWLGRIRSPELTELAEDLLERNYQEVQRELDHTHPEEKQAYELQLFLMHSITISLILKGHQDFSDDYLALLIHNPVENEINRGFQLSYYGDQTYMPTTQSSLKLMDDITTGQRTLNHLFAKTTACLSGESTDPLFDLNLFTICSLLQARIEDTSNAIGFDILPYLRLACKQIRAYLAEHFECRDKLFCNYLSMAERDFERRIHHRSERWSYIGTEVFEEYNRRVLRTGWKECGIPEPESVAEHTYSMWLIGTMFLQDSYPKLSGYSKTEVLSMIMIHDLAETQTGDITTPVKNQNRKNYDAEEDKEMQIFLLRESYPNYACQQENYKLWQQWNDRENINACIAREIDKIQLMYQALQYKLQYPDIMTDQLLRDMMGAVSVITTMPGKQIYHTLIRNNERFRGVFERLRIVL